MQKNDCPVGAAYYAKEGRYEFIAWGPPPEPGDELCRSFTGRTESQLVRDILDGRYDHILSGCTL